jgi:hypothetical protein
MLSLAVGLIALPVISREIQMYILGQLYDDACRPGSAISAITFPTLRVRPPEHVSVCRNFDSIAPAIDFDIAVIAFPARIARR